MRPGESPNRRYYCSKCHPQKCGAPSHRKKIRNCDLCLANAECFRCDVDNKGNSLWPPGATEPTQVWDPSLGVFTEPGTAVKAIDDSDVDEDVRQFVASEITRLEKRIDKKFDNPMVFKRSNGKWEREMDVKTSGETNKPTLMERVKTAAVDDAKVVGTRIVAIQTVRMVKDPLAKAIEDRFPGDPLTRQMVAAFIQTPMGEAVLSILLSTAISTLPIPGVPAGDKRETLARAMRQEGELYLANSVVEMIAAPLRQILVDAIAKMPEVQEERSTPFLAAAPNSFGERTTTGASTKVGNEG